MSLASFRAVGLLLRCLLLFIGTAAGLAETDTITWGGDNSRTGYQTNHNFDPAVVGSSDFGQIFRIRLPGNFNGIGPEQIFSQPLVYTGGDGVQHVYLATSQNNVYKLDAKTGEILMSRNLHVPFLTADLDGCVDINPAIGVTATAVIDRGTGIMYFTAKTYSEEFQDGNFGPSNPPGRLNGRYYFHAINTADLSEAPNFPVLVDGLIFRNNPDRMFIGGNQLQRPGLLHVGEYIYTGYASHCVQYNFTGAIIGFNKNTGDIVESYALQGGPEPNDIRGAGVWMSGGGLAYDGQGSMFFATGNGYASQLPPTGKSVQGRNPPSAVEQAAVNAKINDDGSITVVDFFMPWEKTQLDGADKDLGTSPLQILPGTFSCPNHNRIGVVTGKSGKTYWLDLDNLGGYQMGPNKKDDVIQVYQNENSVYAGAGVFPLDGGYIYINVIQYPTHVFKFSCNADGDAVFTHVADTAQKNAYILGVGHGTTTSLDGREGTGLFWVTDVEGQNLRIYDPIPPSPGANLRLLQGFNIPGVTKFSRPMFGDGRAYIGTTTGWFYGFGAPVNQPLNCSSPYNFPRTSTGSESEARIISCTANIATTITHLNLTGNANFIVSDVPSIPQALSEGDQFSFSAVFAPKTVGTLSSDVTVTTENGEEGYSSNTAITLKGDANSESALLAISPNTISFNVIASEGGTSQSIVFANNGDALLSLDEVSYSLVSEQGPWVEPNVTSSGGQQVGMFTFSDVPDIIEANGIAPVRISYDPMSPGNHAVYVQVSSNGGSKILNVFGVAGSQPSALFEFQSTDGTEWLPYTPGQPFTFGDVNQGTTRSLRFRVTNDGSDTAAPLSLTVSKPPFGVPGIVGAANAVDLAEGTILAAGESASAVLFCAVPKRQLNTPSFSGNATWTINTGDPLMGKQDIRFSCNAVAEQVGPLLSNGTAKYGYLGCYEENNPGRQLDVQAYGDGDNTNGRCIDVCNGRGYSFAGTQYQRECWCGNTSPSTKGDEDDCNYVCSGEEEQTCGGNGYFHNQSHMSLFGDGPGSDDGSDDDPGDDGGDDDDDDDDDDTTTPVGIPASVGDYDFLGCYAEAGAKTFNLRASAGDDMTVESCRAFCDSSRYFGLQYARECFCGSSIRLTSTLTSASECNMGCSGASAQFCGAGNRMQVYELGGGSASSATGTSTVLSNVGAASSTASSTSSSSTPTGPSVVQFVLGYTSIGCHSEIPNGRALSALYADDSMTIEMCAAQAAEKGYVFFGVEYGRECWMGSELSSEATPADQGRCGFLCPGDATQYCGAGGALQMYSADPVAGSAGLDGARQRNDTQSGGLVAAGVSAQSRLRSSSVASSIGQLPTSTDSSSVEGSSAISASSASKIASPLGSPSNGRTSSTASPPSTKKTSSIVESSSTGKDSSTTKGTSSSLATSSSEDSSSRGTSTTKTGMSSSSQLKTSSLAQTTKTGSISSSHPASSTMETSTKTYTGPPRLETSPISCPDSNHTLRASYQNSTFLMSCATIFLGQNMTDAGQKFETMEQCIGKCANTTGCLAVAWLPILDEELKGDAREAEGNCFWKDEVGKNRTVKGVWGGRKWNGTILLGVEE